MPSSQHLHSESNDMCLQLRPAKPLTPTHLNPQPLPRALPLAQTHHSSATTDPPILSSTSVSAKHLEDRRVDRQTAATSFARPSTSRPISAALPTLGDRIARRGHPHDRALAQKRLRGSSPSASSSTSSLQELEAKGNITDHLPAPHQTDLMARVHRRRYSESNTYFTSQRAKRAHPEHDVHQDPQQSSSAPQVKKPLSLADFHLNKVLGSGGTATVIKAEPIPGSLAEQVIPVKEVALKAVSKKGLGRRAQHYLAREIAIHRTVQGHPHIVGLYDVFEDSSGIYFALEMLRGSDLYGILRRERRGISERHALLIIEQVFDALEHMHAIGCAHRDIKPENLMFTEKPNLSEGRLGVVKLIDFGLACARNPNAPEKDRMSSETCGTIRYAAPEIVTEAAYVPEYCDIWSAGIVLYSMIAHRNPYTGKTEKEVLHQIQNTTLSFDGADWERVSEDTKRFIRACLNRKANERPTAAAARVEIGRILNVLATQASEAFGKGDDSTWDARTSRRARVGDGQRGGHDFSRFSSNVTGDSSSMNGRRERSRKDSSSALQGSGDEGIEQPMNFFEGVRAWFSGSSPDRDGSDTSN